MLETAVPVYPHKYLKAMNISMFFVVDFPFGYDLTFDIAGKSEYQVFLNGELIGYGPAKAAHNYHRVDSYQLQFLQKRNRIVVILSGYNCFNFDRPKERPFIAYELKSGDKVIEHSSKKSLCYLNKGRIQKVTRFSYQRAFSESYSLDFNQKIFRYGNRAKGRLELDEVRYGTYLERKVSYPRLEFQPFELVEKNRINIDPSKPLFNSRFYTNDRIGIFKENELSVKPSDLVSLFSNGERKPLNSAVAQGETLAFSYDASLTGFICLDIEVSKTSYLYVYFDEISKSDFAVDFDFFRNSTQNIVSYVLKRGKYRLISFAPYTAKYIRVALTKGLANISKLGIIKLQNPDVSFDVKYKDGRINEIIKAAINTFSSNALDILTDCPSRERAGWLFDSYFSGRAETLLTGQNKVERNFLENYALYQEHGDVIKGMIPMCYPADFPNDSFIPNWAMWYGIELLSYYQRTNDREIIEMSKRNIDGLLKYFEGFENDHFLLEDLDGWVFVEWSKENEKESISGVNLPTNMLYAAFLEAVSSLYGDEYLLDKAEHIKEIILDLGFDGRFFVDNLIRDDGRLIRTNRYGETTQYYALYFGIVKPADNKEFFDTMVNKFGPKRDASITYPYVYKSNVLPGDFMRLEVLNKYRCYRVALEEVVDYFYPMAAATGTLWEHDSVKASLNHGFTSFAVNIIKTAMEGLTSRRFIK